MLTEEKLSQIKEHLLKQLTNFPEDQRNLIKEQITSMGPAEMEEFLKQNELNYNSKDAPKQECIFCAITKKKITSYVLDEDKDCLAILELNPITKGHTLIIPKEHLSENELKDNMMGFAKKVAQQISDKLKPNDIQFSKNEVLGHGMIDVLPTYDKETNLERKKATNEELTALQKQLTEKAKEIPKVEEKPKEQKPEPLPKIKLRIP